MLRPVDSPDAAESPASGLYRWNSAVQGGCDRSGTGDDPWQQSSRPSQMLTLLEGDGLCSKPPERLGASFARWEGLADERYSKRQSTYIALH